MIKTLDIYKNYGCLAAEKRNIYTYGMEEATAVCSDTLTVEIPDGWEIGKNYYGNLLLLSPWGENYTPNDILAGNEHPYFIVTDKDRKTHKYKLHVINKTEEV